MSSILSSGSNIASSYYESRAQASVYNRAARQALIESEMQAGEIRDQTQAMLGRQRTLYAKAGVDVTSGSPLLMMEDTRAEGEYRAKLAEWGGAENWKMNRWYAHVAKHGGDVGMWQSGASIGLTIASMVAGGMAGGAAASAAGGSGAMGFTAGAMNAASGGSGWGSLLNSITGTRGKQIQ